VIQLVAGTALAARRRGEGAAVRWAWSVALVSALPRLASSTAYGTVWERTSIWLIAGSGFLYLCATLTPPSGVTQTPDAAAHRATTDAGRVPSALRHGGKRREVSAASPLRGAASPPLRQQLLGADRSAPSRGRRKAVSFAEAGRGADTRYGAVVRGPSAGALGGGGGGLGSSPATARRSSALGGWDAADEERWDAASPFVEGTPPVVGLQGLRVLTGSARLLGLALLGWSLRGKLSAEAGASDPWSGWTVTQSCLLLLVSLLLPLPALVAACMSAPREDSTGSARLTHLAAGWASALVGTSGPGAVATVLLWALSADGAAPWPAGNDWGPWIAALPLASQSGVVAVVLVIGAVVLAVSEGSSACRTVLTAATTAVVGSAAVLLPLLPAARAAPFGGEPSADGGDDMPWAVVLVPALVLGIGAVVLLLLLDAAADSGVGAWRPLRFDAAVAAGYTVSAALAAAAVQLGLVLPHPGWSPPPRQCDGSALCDPLVIAAPALVAQATCLAADVVILSLHGLAACGALRLEPGSDGLDDDEGAAGWGAFLLLDDSLMANIAADVAMADAAGRFGVDATGPGARRRSRAQSGRSTDRPAGARRDGGAGGPAASSGGLAATRGQPSGTMPSPGREAGVAGSLQTGRRGSGRGGRRGSGRSTPGGGGGGGVVSGVDGLDARQRVLDLRSSGTPVGEWDGADVAAWLEAVVRWGALAGPAAVALGREAAEGEAEGSALLRLWLRGKAAGDDWAELRRVVGRGHGGTGLLVAELVQEAGRPMRASAARRSARGRRTSSGAGGGTLESLLGTADGESVVYEAADDDAEDRALRAARAATRQHEGGAEAAARAEAELQLRQRLESLPHDWVWTVWLPQVGLPQLEGAFAAAGVTPLRLAAMHSHSDFSVLGVRSAFQRRSLRAGVAFLRRHGFDVRGQIAELRRERWVPRPALPDHLPAWTNRDVVAWLRQTIPLHPDKHGRQLERLCRNGLHGALLFRRKPFRPDDVIAGFGLTRASARPALVGRIERSLDALRATGASASIRTAHARPPTPPPSAMEREALASDDGHGSQDDAGSHGAGRGSPPPALDEPGPGRRAAGPSSVGDTSASSAGSARMDSVVSAAAFANPWSREAMEVLPGAGAGAARELRFGSEGGGGEDDAPAPAPEPALPGVGARALTGLVA